MDLETINLELQYNYLTTLGDVYSLDIFFNKTKIDEELRPFSESWRHYNPRKPHIPRFGLSLTSLDGGLSGVPDLDSIAEYNHQNQTTLGDESFTTITDVLKNSNALKQPISAFLPHLGRSHLLRLNKGGYFPFHRDSQQFGAKTFRLISLLNNCGSDTLCFIFNHKRIFLNTGKLYFMNTKVTHALFSFCDDATILVLNVIVSQASVDCVRAHLFAK